MFRILSLLSLFLSFNLASAFPLKSSQPFSAFDPQIAKSDALFTADYNFEGIVALSNCSGSLVRFQDSRDTDAAMVLTNGHCMGSFPAPGEVVYKQPSRRSFTLLAADGSDAGRVNAKQLLFGTMTKTDMAIYVLEKNYQQILTEFNIRPLTLSANYVQLGEPIEVISGYWRRGYKCQAEAFIPTLKEGAWTFSDSLRYSRPGCNTIGGTSGSPVILGGTRTVIAVNNTGNEGGTACSENNPCEVDQNGNVSSNKGYSYGQQTSWIYSCLTNTGDLVLSKAGCLLPKGRN